MTQATLKLAKAEAAKYEHEDVQDAYLRGFDRGYNCASWINLPEIGAKVWTDSDGYLIVDADNMWDIVGALAGDGESNDRQFSPFEFTASEFNGNEELSEELWDAFDNGINEGINANVRERSEAYAR